MRSTIKRKTLRSQTINNKESEKAVLNKQLKLKNLSENKKLYVNSSCSTKPDSTTSLVQVNITSNGTNSKNSNSSKSKTRSNSTNTFVVRGNNKAQTAYNQHTTSLVLADKCR